jgi:DNA gyrase subunit B
VTDGFPTYNGPVRLEDCARHGPGSGAELIIVEGLSAAQAVLAVRDPDCQAVLPMQGKPVNASKAKPRQVLSNPLFQALISAVAPAHSSPPHTMDAPATEAYAWRYERILLLCDPDADGIHCSALLLIFIAKYLQPWLEAGRVLQVHAPVAKVVWTDTLGKPHQAHSPTIEHAAAFVEQLKQARYTDVKRHHYRGLAGIDQEVLKRCCVSMATRTVRQLSPSDAELVLRYFGGV